MTKHEDEREDAAQIKGALHYEPKGSAQAQKAFPGHFAREFAAALATAK